jgi:predicted hydrocarbon binding protein
LAEDDGRYLKYRKTDIITVRGLHENVMSEAAHGLLFRTGQMMGSRIARTARPYKQQYFEAARRIMVDEGWARDIQFSNEMVVVTGSIETEKSEGCTCHMLRGVLAKIYEGYFGKVMHCTEVECDSLGKGKCTFKLSFQGMADKQPARKA